MKKIVLFALVAILASATAPAAAPRQPTGKWVVDFAAHQCIATRQYGSEERPLILVLKPSPMGKLMQISVVRKVAGSSVAAQAPVTLEIDGGAPLRSSLLAFNPRRNRGFRFLRINMPLEDFAPMRAAARVAIKARGEIDESFVLTQMPALMTQMDRCLVDLQEHWNIGEVAQARLRSRASGDISRYFSSDDYPTIALMRDGRGRAEFAVLIDETGKVADCTLTETSGVAVLDAQTCAVLAERARFTPAIGADGKPARDALSSRVRWELD